jgi:hypothetical protein
MIFRFDENGCTEYSLMYLDYMGESRKQFIPQSIQYSAHFESLLPSSEFLIS